METTIRETEGQENVLTKNIQHFRDEVAFLIFTLHINFTIKLNPAKLPGKAHE